MISGIIITVICSAIALSPFLIMGFLMFYSIIAHQYEQERFERLVGWWDESRERTLWYRLTH